MKDKVLYNSVVSVFFAAFFANIILINGESELIDLGRKFLPVRGALPASIDILDRLSTAGPDSVASGVFYESAFRMICDALNIKYDYFKVMNFALSAQGSLNSSLKLANAIEAYPDLEAVRLIRSVAKSPILAIDGPSSV